MSCPAHAKTCTGEANKEMSQRRAMTSEAASNVKREGHRREDVFARLIEGEVIKGTGKADIRRGNHTWSVKGGQWSQIFLYRGTRAAYLGPEFRECLDVFPDDRKDYLDEKKYYKAELARKMRILCGHLNDQRNLEAFLYRAIFAEFVDFLAIEKREGQFLEFDADEVVGALLEGLTITNSRGDQKVIFHVEGIKAALGEIEVRTDSDQHYRELKCRFNLPRLRKFLEARCAVNEYLV